VARSNIHACRNWGAGDRVRAADAGAAELTQLGVEISYRLDEICPVAT